MKNKKLLLIVLLLILCLNIGTFAWLRWRSSETAMVLTIGTVDNVTISLQPYRFKSSLSPVLTYENNDYVSITAVNNTSSPYEKELFYKVNSIPNELKDSSFKYTITKSTDNNTFTELKTGNFLNANSNEDFNILQDEQLEPNSTTYYRVYLWIDGNEENNSNMQGKVFNAELRAGYGVLGPSVPAIDEGMIPIIIDTSNGTTIKTVSEDDPNWYNYDNQKWANMVLVTDASRSTYKNANPGTVVNPSDILAYYVWIPRYKYRIWTTTSSSTGQEQEINILYESKDEPKSLGTQVGEYRTHPAFTFGDTEISGLWVGKFELTGTESSPTVLPDTPSLRNLNVSQLFNTSKLIFNYGLSNTSDAHMMKNSEWGAAAYLSHSRYGINREVYINNSSGYYTGRSGGNVSGSTAINTVYTDQTSTTRYNNYGFYTWDGYLLDYNTNNKSTTRDETKVASTTGNISGIYDMSGGASEYVMGYYSAHNPSAWGALIISGTETNGAGFTTAPEAKYYDNYTTTTSSTACNGGICYGHALSETSGWYGDYARFIAAGNPWLNRGGIYFHDGTLAGAFYSFYRGGYSSSDYGVRSTICVECKPAQTAFQIANPNINVTLESGMIPVRYDMSGTKSDVIVADPNAANWANYANKEWANMVLVTDASRANYQNNIGAVINEADILGYYVWIPRYKYKLFDRGNTSSPPLIEIAFESADTAKSSGTATGEWRTHPAFTFGNSEVEGFWIGKFELTGTATAPTVKPDVSSLRSQNVSSFFNIIKGISVANGIHGIKDADSHMLKNSEWGAVAYLSHSTFGVGREIYINNSSSYYTGRSGGNVGGSTAINTVYTDQTSTTQYNNYGFYTWDGYLLEYGTNNKSTTRDVTKVASTTGNVYGVYDMSGGAWEYVMGYYSAHNPSTWGVTSSPNYAGFTTAPDDKYYDNYMTTSATTSCNGICYGHALSETSDWYGDYAYFVSASIPWLLRGGSYYSGASAGAFHSHRTNGSSNSSYGARVCLAFA